MCSKTSREKGTDMRISMKIAARVFIFGMLLSPAGLAITARGQELSGMKMQPGTLSTTQKIALALSAGPSNVANGATVVEPDGHGGRKVLRQGTNGFTCMPGDPSGVGMPPM